MVVFVLAGVTPSNAWSKKYEVSGNVSIKENNMRSPRKALILISIFTEPIPKQSA